jgi:hypothetical protein
LSPYAPSCGRITQAVPHPRELIQSMWTESGCPCLVIVQDVDFLPDKLCNPDRNRVRARAVPPMSK